MLRNAPVPITLNRITWYRKWIDGWILILLLERCCLQIWCSCIHLFNTFSLPAYWNSRFQGISKQIVGARQRNTLDSLPICGINKKKASNFVLSHCTKLSLTSSEDYLFVSWESILLPIWETRQNNHNVAEHLPSLVFSGLLFSSDRHIMKTESTSSDRGPEETPSSSSARER